MPTSASPPHSSPTLTESTSNSASNSSSSPPEPATPTRISRRARYADLGRVPLHRRGTSKKYEALEDLLKEAGYKETRIFTPETERSEAHRDINGGLDDKRRSMKDGMEAVVGFLAGLIPNATVSKTSLQSNPEPAYTTSPQEYSPPLSPLAQRYAQRNATQSSLDSLDATTPTNITSSIESLNGTTPNTAGRHSVSRSNSPAPTITHPSYLPPLIIRDASHAHQIRKQTSRSSIARPANNNIVSPRPSRAGAYLRHMSSMQTMPERPNSTPVQSSTRPRIQLNDSEPGNYVGRRDNGEGESEDEPPLPPTWLESVARAVLFGGAGAHIGGPTNFALPDHPRHASSSASSKAPRVQVLRPTRSSLSQVSSRRRQPTTARSGLSDQTNTTYSSSGSGGAFLAPPPPLFSKIERGRAGHSEGEVSHTRVLCRSAPGSRRGSPMRGAAEDVREKLRERGREKRKKGDTSRVPSLARTHTEGDVWARPRAAHRERSAGAWGGDAESGSDFFDATAPSSDDEDEGELTLARMLVPPKRQNSIKSLRRHLTAEGAGPSGSAHGTLAGIAAQAGRSGVYIVSGGPPKVQPHRAKGPRAADDLELDGEAAQEWGAGWQRKGRGGRHAEDDDEMEAALRFGSGRSSLGKRRTGFGAAWGS